MYMASPHLPMAFTNRIKTTLVTFLGLLAMVEAQCPSPSGKIQTSVASGYRVQVVATGLSKPRGLAIDEAGRLLVVESGKGTISAHNITEQDGCTVTSGSKDVVAQLSLNHGIQINGSTLFASSSDKLYSWKYDSSTGETSDQQELIQNMEGTDHSTRTLELSQHAPGLMIVSRGSLENLDINATTLAGGTAQVKAFNLANRTKIYDWNSDGRLLAWGVRNEVGLAEHPVTGGIWGVENSADQVSRYGVDVSNDNPGEELNFFGYLNGTNYAEQGGFFGYPWCLAAWNVSDLPDPGDMRVGSQFAFDASSALKNQNRTDAFCANTVAPRLVFQAHQAPLDIKFNDSARDAWITFHGSWDRKEPVGYHVSVVEFAENGEPSEPSTSTSAENVVVKNADNSVCPDDCFRPVAMAFDSQGRVFFSSDASGEIYMVTRDATSNGSSTGSTQPSAGRRLMSSLETWGFTAMALLIFMIV